MRYEHEPILTLVAVLVASILFIGGCMALASPAGAAVQDDSAPEFCYNTVPAALVKARAATLEERAPAVQALFMYSVKYNAMGNEVMAYKLIIDPESTKPIRNVTISIGVIATGRLPNTTMPAIVPNMTVAPTLRT